MSDDEVLAHTPSARFQHKFGALLVFASGHIGVGKKSKTEVFSIESLVAVDKDPSSGMFSDNKLVFRFADDTTQTLKGVCAASGDSAIAQVVHELVALATTYHHHITIGDAQ